MKSLTFAVPKGAKSSRDLRKFLAWLDTVDGQMHLLACKYYAPTSLTLDEKASLIYSKYVEVSR